MTPEIQRILDLLPDVEQICVTREDPLELIHTKIKPAIIDADNSLKEIEDKKLKEALRAVEKYFAKAEVTFRTALSGLSEIKRPDHKEKEFWMDELIIGFDRFDIGRDALYAANKRTEQLKNVESQ
jgi:hypothetical protein